MNDIRKLEKKFKFDVEKYVSPHIQKLSTLETGVVLSSADEDTKHSFDMRVGTYAVVSVRLRRNRYLKYRDFSIRSKTRYSGKMIGGDLVKCEIDKINAGYGSCYFYGWLNPAETQIADYIIVDINALRPFIDNWIYYEERSNGDGTAARYYPVHSLNEMNAVVFDAQGLMDL